jgi:hypothetical protein
MGRGIKVWRVIGSSVPGTSHIEAGLECQDACDFAIFDADNECGLAVAISDGAGSAKYGGEGARSTVRRAIEFMTQEWRLLNRDVESFFIELYKSALSSIDDKAISFQAPVKDFACTLLTAIFIRDKGCFGQVGDGAWVVETKKHTDCMTWPQHGEFINETIFITTENALEKMQIAEEEGLLFFSGFTDGLQGLALHYASNSPHYPFFSHMKKGIEGTFDEKVLERALMDFLNSENVNERTDDDKTLILGLWSDGNEAKGNGPL